MSWRPGVGHIGCGARAQHVMAAMRGHVEFVTCCDLHEERARATQEAFGFKKSTTNWRELMADPEVEFITIVLPPDLNHQVVMEAAPLQKPIWTEKPLDWKLGPAIQMVQECRKYQTPLAVGQQYRYHDVNQVIRRLIADGAIGEPFSGSLDHVFLSDNGGAVWLQRSDRYLVSGMGIHYLDLFRFFLADEADTIYGRVGQAPFRRQMTGALTSEHWCTITVTFKKGAVIQFFCSEDTKGGNIRWSERYHLAGTEGSLFWDAHDPEPLQMYRDATGRREAVPITRPAGDPDPGKGSGANTMLLLEYLDCIQQGIPSPTSGADHLKSLAMAEAAYLSSSTGLPIKVDDLLRHAM